METDYPTKIKSMMNAELDTEFRRINKLRNDTDNDYLDEFECLNRESSWR